MPPPVNLDDKEKETASLKKLTVKRFAANPASIAAFETTTVSWEVVFAADFPEDVSIGIFLDGKPVQAVGSTTIQVSSTRTLTLEARGEHITAALKQLRVQVNDSACRTELVINAGRIVSEIKKAIDPQFSGSSEVRLDGGSSVSLGEGTIGIGIPIKINVPNWFDADMSIGITLSKKSGRPTSASAVLVDVRWNFFEHLASLGCTGVVQSGMEKLAQVFLTLIVQTTMAPAIDAAFNAGVEGFLQLLNRQDAQDRTWVPRTVTLSNDGLTVTACPLPPGEGAAPAKALPRRLHGELPVGPGLTSDR